MKKTLKETKLGKLLNQKLPDAIAIAGDLLPDKGVLGIIKNIIDKSTVSPEEKAELEAELNELVKLDAEDRKDARALQVAALNQDDVFSKRFNYYLAGLCVVIGFVYIFVVTFIPIPEDSQRFADVILGFIASTVFGQILSFYYGSSHSSKQKDVTIADLRK
jgi:hypothetical protein